jgi:hypothetical protein
MGAAERHRLGPLGRRAVVHGQIGRAASKPNSQNAQNDSRKNTVQGLPQIRRGFAQVALFEHSFYEYVKKIRNVSLSVA